MYIDSHAHILSKSLKVDIEGILLRAKQARLSHIINVACEPTDWAPYIALEEAHSDTELHLRTSLGIHPDHFNTPSIDESTWSAEIEQLQEQLEEVIKSFHPVALGECGLDYFRTPHKEAQKALFTMQLKLAKKYNLPCVLHIRDAFDDCFKILDQRTDANVVFHCFTGDRLIAERIITSYPNAYLSFSGITTFSNATAVADAALYTPLDRMFIETDSPYLAPAPLRGKVNEPSYVVHTAAKIAELKHISQEEVAQATSDNVHMIFSL